MTFQGGTIIGKPTLHQIEIYIARKGLCVEPEYVYSYWESKDWKTNKGIEVKTLEAAINVVNGIFVEKHLKMSNSEGKENVQNQSKREKRKAYKTKIKQILKKENELSYAGLQPKPFIKYDEQLKDERWIAFRKFIKIVRGEKCEICGSTTNLQIHHTHYKKNCKAWEYTCNDVLVLCKDCHSKVHNKL